MRIPSSVCILFLHVVFSLYTAAVDHGLLPGALARGFEWGIYCHDMRMYVRTCA